MINNDRREAQQLSATIYSQKKFIDELDLVSIAEEFIARSDERMNFFVTIKSIYLCEYIVIKFNMLLKSIFTIV